MPVDCTSISRRRGRYGLMAFAGALCLLQTACPASPSRSAGASPPGVEPPAVCTRQDTIAVAAPDETDQAELVLRPDPFGMGPPRQGWRGDLNGDGLSDLILIFPESCGNWGDCPHGVFAGCGRERYATVWAPEYAVDLSAGAHRARVADGDWLDLVELRRAGTAEKPDAESRTLRFDGSRYQPVSATEPAPQPQ